MPQFDLYENTDDETKNAYPYFIDVQTGLLDDLNSRVVIPLVPALDAGNYPRNLCPVVLINNENYAVMTHQITTVSLSFLSEKDGSLLLYRDDIISSIDFLFTGI